MPYLDWFRLDFEQLQLHHGQLGGWCIFEFDVQEKTPVRDRVTFTQKNRMNWAPIFYEDC